MDVAIYEVNKNDLMRLGNQIGGTVLSGGQLVPDLNNLGGTEKAAISFTGNFAAGLARSDRVRRSTDDPPRISEQGEHQTACLDTDPRI